MLKYFHSRSLFEKYVVAKKKKSKRKRLIDFDKEIILNVLCAMHCQWKKRCNSSSIIMNRSYDFHINSVKCSLLLYNYILCVSIKCITLVQLVVHKKLFQKANAKMYWMVKGLCEYLCSCHIVKDAQCKMRNVGMFGRKL